MIKKWLIILFLGAVLLTACTEKGELGSKSNPIKMYFVPSMEAGKVVTSGEAIAQELEKMTGFKFKVAVPTSYAAVIEAMGSNQADIGWLPTFAYILAKEKYDAKLALTTVRNGLEAYRGQFITKANSSIKNLEDIKGKTIAYTDAASTSGYIYPSALLKQKGITPKKYYFSGGHPAAVLAVYQNRADVACTYWSPEEDGIPQDARNAVLSTHPDVMEKVVPVAFTDWIPNDTVTFRNGIKDDIIQKISDALVEYSETSEGKANLKELYSVDGFVRSKDSDYDVVREALITLEADAGDFIK